MAAGCRTPLATAIVLAVVNDCGFAFRACSGDFVFEKFDQPATLLTFDVENRFKAPFMPVISATFSHDYRTFLNTYT